MMVCRPSRYKIAVAGGATRGRLASVVVSGYSLRGWRVPIKFRVSFRTRMLAVLGIILTALPVARATATVVREVQFAEQCATAGAIVVGTVRDVSSRRMASAPTFF